MSGYKYSAKQRLCSHQAMADALKLEAKVPVNFAVPAALYGLIDKASKSCFQMTKVPVSGLLASLKMI